MASSPLIIVPTTTSVAAVLVSVKARPGNDGACGQGRATADLDRPCARRPQHVWVGAKKRDSESNKETGMKEVESGVKHMLDFKSPIQGLLGLHSRYGPPDRSAAHARPLSRGSSPSGYPAEPLVSYQINRQLSGWNLPPLVIRGFGAHCQHMTCGP